MHELFIYVSLVSISNSQLTTLSFIHPPESRYRYVPVPDYYFASNSFLFWLLEILFSNHQTGGGLSEVCSFLSPPRFMGTVVNIYDFWPIPLSRTSPKFKFMFLKTPTNVSMFYFRCTLGWYTLMIHITFKICVNIFTYTQLSSGLIRKLRQKLWWNADIPTVQLFVMNTLQLTSQNMPAVHTDYTHPHQMHHWISSAFPQASCCNTFQTLITWFYQVIQLCREGPTLTSCLFHLAVTMFAIYTLNFFLGTSVVIFITYHDTKCCIQWFMIYHCQSPYKKSHKRITPTLPY